MKIYLTLIFLIFMMGCSTNKTVMVNPANSYDAELTGYQYPYAVKFFPFESQKQKMQMAYMDLPSEKSNGKTIVLLHGKNFGGYAFKDVARKLSSQGYRVIMPDQIGFGKSTKPKNFQYSFQTLALFTNNLLTHIGADEYFLLGHSMGGMLATRMALMYPEKVKKLILVNPLGLEDWKLLTPYKSIDDLYRDELKQTPEAIKKYQLDAYYAGHWKPEYEPLIEAASGWTRHSDYPLVAWNSALTYDMIFTQPVIYEFKNLKVPTALIIGQRDRTAPGKGWAPEENKKKMGNYPELGRQAAKLIPGAQLIEFEGIGHVPFIEDFDQFFEKGLNKIL